jgi:hypothetical protein
MIFSKEYVWSNILGIFGTSSFGICLMIDRDWIIGAIERRLIDRILRYNGFDNATIEERNYGNNKTHPWKMEIVNDRQRAVQRADALPGH